MKQGTANLSSRHQFLPKFLKDVTKAEMDRIANKLASHFPPFTLNVGKSLSTGFGSVAIDS